MPSQSIDHDQAEDRAATALLAETVISVAQIELEGGRAERIQVSYTLYPEGSDETLVHVYEFFTDEFDDDGVSAWAEFVELITSDDDSSSLIYHAKRNGGVMYEFTNLCLDIEQQAAAA